MMKKSKEKSEFILIATVGKSKGLKGEFFLNSLCDPKENILNYSNFKIGFSKLPIKFEYIKLLNNKLISKIIDISDVDDIKKFTNESIFIEKSELPELPNDEIYWHDLIGMQVLNIKNQDIGIIEEINNYGASDILKVGPSKSSIDKETRLIPYIKEKYIISHSYDKNCLVVDWELDF